MARRMTDDQIARLAPKVKQYAVTIPTAPGLQIRVSPGGRKAWSLRYQDTFGKQKRRTLGIFPQMTLLEAEKLARAPDELAGPMTIEQLVEAFLARHKRLRAAEDRRILTGRVYDHFGKRTKLSNIKRRDVASWRDAMVAEGLKAAANRYYGTFRTCWRWGLGADLMEHDVTIGIKLAVKESPRERLITDDEVGLLWHGLGARSKSAQHAVRLCLATGLRIGEVVSARWEHVEPDCWTIPATATKAKRTHLVPVSAYLRGLLDETKKDLLGRGGFLFPGDDCGHLAARSPGRVIRRCFEEFTGSLRIHDARRLVGTWMARDCVSPEVIAAVLGHAPSGVTAVHYIHAEAMLPRQAAALEAWQKHLKLIVKQKTGGPIEGLC